VVTDTLEIETFAEGGEDPGRVAVVLSEDRKAWWVAPGNDGLADDLDSWLAARSADGTLAALRARYLGAAAAGDGGLPAGPGRVVDLVARRLLLMPEVAAAKAVAGMPVEVPAREAEVLERARGAAASAGLAVAPYVAFFRTQMEVAKVVQGAALRGRRPAPAAPDAPDGAAAARARLDGHLRPAIDRLDGQIRAALAAQAPLPGTPEALAAALRADAPVPGLDAPQARRLAEALLAVPAPRPGRREETA